MRARLCFSSDLASIFSQPLLGRSELIITALKSGQGACEIGPLCMDVRQPPPTPWIVLREMKKQGRDVTAVEPGYVSGYERV